MKVSLDRKSEATSYLHNFRKADVTEFGAAEAEIAETEEPVRFIRIALGEKPCCPGVWRKELHDWQVIGVWTKGIHEKLDAVGDRQEGTHLHWEAPAAFWALLLVVPLAIVFVVAF